MRRLLQAYGCPGTDASSPRGGARPVHRGSISEDVGITDRRHLCLCRSECVLRGWYLAKFAEDIGVEYSTLRDYKRVAAAYSEKSVRTENWSVAKRLASQPDRLELVKTVCTVKEARELVKGRKRDTKVQEAAETPQPHDVYSQDRSC